MRFAAASAVVVLLVMAAEAQVAADLVIINADVWTMADRQPRAEAVAVVGNKIAAVGSTSEIRKLVGERTKVIDAGGKLVLPGFNDSHVHFMSIGNLFSTLDLRKIRTAGELSELLKHYSRFLPKGRWILGSGGTDELWKQIDGEMVDHLTRNNPLFLYHTNATSAVANSAAIVAGNVRAARPGIVAGPQFDRIRFVVPNDHSNNWAEVAETASNYAASFGITSVQDTDSDDHAEIYRELARTGKLKVRVYDCHGLSNWKKYADAGIKSTGGDALVRTGCLKGNADIDENGKADLQREVIAADKAGMQILIHAIGSAMNKTALDVFENAAKVNGKRDRRFRVEHAERAAPSDISRFARLGIIASMQPYLFGWSGLENSYNRLIRQAGSKFAFGSDAAITSIDPLLGVQAAAYGAKSFEEVERAIKGYTIDSAYAEFQENTKGSIEVGKLADIVVIAIKNKNDASSVKDNWTVNTTIVDGRIVYNSELGK